MFSAWSFRALCVGVVLVFALAVGAVGVSIWQDRSHAIDDGVRDAHNIAVILGGQIARSLQSVDIVLRDVQGRSREQIAWTQSGSLAVNPAALHGMLRLHLAELPQAFQLAVTDDRGRIPVSTAGWPARDINVADRDYFQELAANDDDRLSISLPFDNRVTGEPTIVLARRISGPERAFLGVVLVSMRKSYFENIYRALDSLPDQTFTLLRRDGTVLFRYPDTEDRAGQKVPATFPFHALVADGGGSYRSTGAFDPVVRWAAINPLKEYPLVVNILTPEDVLLRDWRARATVTVAVTLAFLACLCVLLWVMARHTRGLAHSESALLAYRDRTAAELDAARKMQAGLLPSAGRQDEIMARSGLDIASRFATCTELAGDFWGMHELGDGRLGVYVVDFSGHGTGPALNTFRLHTLINEVTGLLCEPAQFLTALNLRLIEYLAPGEFATMFHAVVDPAAGRMTYAAAGAPPPIMRCGNGRPLVALDSSGLPLGITASAEYECAEAAFGHGAMLFLYSDVFTDFLDAGGRPCGKAGALELALGCADAPTAETFVERVCAPFLGGSAAALGDDLTAVCIVRP